MTLIPRVTELLRGRGLADVPVFVGGIIPDADRENLQRRGVARVYTPGEATLTEIIADIVETVAQKHSRAGGAA
jgi:methylmalonyl-CoA mutase cobalamin-binding domain/chain